MTPQTQTPVEVVGVADYSDRLNAALRRAGSALVEGEAQEVKDLRNGVVSFTLTDGTHKLPCKFLPWMNRRRPLTHRPSDGDQVRAHVRHAEWWGEGGRASLVVTDVSLAGEGELLRARARVIAKLAEEGLCDRAAFPTLPRFPRGVGVIAGRDSDALADVLQGLADRLPSVPVFTCCCRVQGAGAPEQVKEALIALHRQPLVDVIVIARGGGSVQELAAFDDEGLCRAIRALGTPVVTAIGHTQNNPVCNHVTHAAFVPRHAAEMVVRDRRDLLRDVDEAAATMARATAELRAARARFEEMAGCLHGQDRVEAVRAQLLAHAQVIDARAEAFASDGEALLAGAREALARIPARLRATLADCERALAAFPGAAQHAGARPRALAEDLAGEARLLWQAAARVEAAERQDMGRALARLAHDRRQAAARLLAGAGVDVERATAGLGDGTRRQAEAWARDADGLAAVLEAADFRRRGWLLAAREAGGAPVSSVVEMTAGERLRLYLRDGEADTVVADVNPTEHEGSP